MVLGKAFSIQRFSFSEMLNGFFMDHLGLDEIAIIAGLCVIDCEWDTWKWTFNCGRIFGFSSWYLGLNFGKKRFDFNYTALCLKMPNIIFSVMQKRL